MLQKRRLSFLLVAAVLTSTPVAGQDSGFVGTLTPYARALIHAAFVDDDARMENSGSWIGLEFTAGDSPRVFGQVEWGMNLIEGESLSLGAATGGGFSKVTDAESDPFGLRLGYIGVDLGSGGRIALGKQNSPHYDVASFTTDRWNVFGGQGSLAYPAGTDGGGGTARANQALTYRVDVLDGIALGTMAQFGSDDTFADAVGLSAVASLLEGFRFGASYTYRAYDEDLQASIIDVEESGSYIAAGATFDTDRLQLGAVVTSQTSGDLIRVPAQNAPDVAFDGIGFELFARLNGGRFTPLAGIVFYDPDSANAAISPDFKTQYLILGGELAFTENAYLYGEARIDDSVDAFGTRGSSALAIGFRYGFSLTTRHGVY